MYLHIKNIDRSCNARVKEEYRPIIAWDILTSKESIDPSIVKQEQFEQSLVVNPKQIIQGSDLRSVFWSGAKFADAVRVA